MHNKMLDQQTILNTKKQLAIAIEKHNYNLQAPEVLELSERLDKLMLPAFKSQLDFYNYYLNHSHPFMT